MSVLKWIWGLLKKLLFFVDYVVRFLLEIFSSVLSWVIAGVAYLVHLVFQYVGEFFESLFENLADLSLGDIPVSPLATWIAREVIALPVAWECFMIYFAAWVATRIARSSFACVRLLIDLA